MSASAVIDTTAGAKDRWKREQLTSRVLILVMLDTGVILAAIGLYIWLGRNEGIAGGIVVALGAVLAVAMAWGYRRLRGQQVASITLDEVGAHFQLSDGRVLSFSSVNPTNRLWLEDRSGWKAPKSDFYGPYTYSAGILKRCTVPVTRADFDEIKESMEARGVVLQRTPFEAGMKPGERTTILYLSSGAAPRASEGS